MGILQEYRFYLILLVVSLAAIISLFFLLLGRNEFVDYETKLTAHYAQVKSIAGERKSLSDVLSPDGVTLIGTKGTNSLFGLDLEGQPEDILLMSKNSLSTITIPEIGKYSITFVSSEDLNHNGSNVDSIALKDMEGSDNDISKGWHLDTDGVVIYSFHDKETAEDIGVKYLTEATVYENKIISKFSKASSGTFAKEVTGILNGTITPSVSTSTALGEVPYAVGGREHKLISYATGWGSDIISEGDTGKSFSFYHQIINGPYNYDPSTGYYTNINFQGDIYVTYKIVGTGTNPIDQNDISGVVLDQEYNVTLVLNTTFDPTELFDIVEDGISEPAETFEVVVTRVGLDPIDAADVSSVIQDTSASITYTIQAN